MNIFKNLTLAAFIVLAIVFMIVETKEMIVAVNLVIILWATKVFPVLFPFYIIATLAIKYGVAHFIGELLKPITTRLFKTSPISGFVFFMSLIAGNPSSAIIISQLYEDKSITKTEATHLLSFCVFVNPIFCIGTIGIVYFRNSSIGYIVLIAHIVANILIGILMRFSIKSRERATLSFKNAYLKMVNYKKHHKQSFAEVMTQILQQGMNTMFLIGGFMIFYGVVIVILKSSSFIDLSYHALSSILNLFHIDYNVYKAFFTGMFEMVLGVDAIVDSQFPLRFSVTFITMIISFGGFSIHSQIHSILYKVKLRYTPFLMSRIAQMVFSGIIAYYLFPFIYKERTIDTIFYDGIIVPEKSMVFITLMLCILILFAMLMRFFNQQKKTH